MAIKKLQPGYRIRMTIFVPYDPTDPKSIRAALDYADAVQQGAPENATVENFSFQPGRLDTADAPAAPAPTPEKAKT